MSNVEKMGAIVENYGKNGLRFLFLFKIVKNEVQSHIYGIDDSVVNAECAKLAEQLLVADKETPTEEEIRRIIENLNEKHSIHSNDV